MQTKDPFFIFYDSRSGSTFLAKTLTKYARIAMPPETNFITALIDEYKKTSISDANDLKKALDVTFNERKFVDWSLSREEIENEVEDKLPISLADFIKTILELYRKKFVQKAEFVGIKKNYIRHFKKLQKIFPDSKIIILVRDGRAVFNSKKNSIYSVTGKPFETDPANAAKIWIEELQMANKYIKRTANMKKFYYENLIKDTDGFMKDVLNFIEIPEDKGNASNYFVIKERYGNIHENVEKETDSSKLSQFKQKLSPEEIAIFEKIAGKYLIAEGYELINKKINLIQKYIIRTSKRPAKQLLWLIINNDLQQSERFNTGVDVACGDMFFYPYFKTKSYIAIDADEERLKKAKEKIDADIVTIHSFIEEMDTEKIHGDFVTCIQTLGINNDFEVKNTLLAINQLIKITNKEGVLIFNMGEGSMAYEKEVDELLQNNFNKVKKTKYGNFKSEKPYILSLFLAILMYLVSFVRGTGFNYYYCESKKV